MTEVALEMLKWMTLENRSQYEQSNYEVQQAAIELIKTAREGQSESEIPWHVITETFAIMERSSTPLVSVSALETVLEAYWMIGDFATARSLLTELVSFCFLKSK